MEEPSARQSPEPVGNGDEQLAVDEVYDLLWQAIERNDVTAVRQLLDRFISIYPFLLRWQDKEMAMPRLVTIAARSGAVGVLEVLLEHHVCRESFDDDAVRRPFFTPLNAACQAAQTGAVRYLLDLHPPWDIEEMDDYGNTPLLSALQADYRQAEQREEIVRLLLDRGADATVVVKGDDDDQTLRATVLTMAMPSASPRVIKWLVDAGASLDIRRETMTLLHLGCQHHNAAAVRTLLDLGAASDLTTPDSGGRLPLHTAVDWVTFQQVKYAEHPSHKPISITSIHETVALLLSDDKIRRATLNAQDALGRTPLHLVAGSFRYLPVLRQLLDHGADPSIRSSDGRSLLHIVLSSSTYQYSTKSDFNYREREVYIDEALFRRLLRATTNTTMNQDESPSPYLVMTLVNEPDGEGNTPLHLAATAWLEGGIAILLHLGADPLARNQDGNTPAHLAAEVLAVRPHITEGDDDGVIADALATQDRVLSLLLPPISTPTPPHTQTQSEDSNNSSSGNEPRNRAGETARSIMQRERAVLRRRREWFVKERALREESARELMRIAQLPVEVQDEARRSSKWYGVGRGWGAGRDLLWVANAHVYGLDGGGRGHGVDGYVHGEDVGEIMRRLDGLLQEQSYMA